MQTVTLSDATHRTLLTLAGDGPIDPVIAEAVEDLRRKRLLDDANAGFAALRSDPAAWDEESAERRATEGTIGDGLGAG